MLTKLLTSFVMTGALWVAGDAAYQSVGCCLPGSECCNPPQECCIQAKQTTAEDCCSSGSECCSPPRECCFTAKTVKAKSDCCADK